MSTEITIVNDIIEINVTEEPITIEAPSGAYPLPNAVDSVFGRTGNVVATEGDYTLTQLGGVTITTPSAGQALVYNGTAWVNSTESYVGTVTSVAASVPTGLTITGSPITTSGTLAFGLQTGYSIPTTASQTTWDTAYNRSLTSAAVTGTTTKTLTLNQQSGGTVTASWTDDNTDAVTSVFGRTGAVVATEGDYSLTQLSDVTLTSPANGQVLKYNGTSWVNGTDTDTGLTSVGLSMPSAFSVANSPLTANGTLAVTGAGVASQYIRGDGTLANFPTSGGGGSSVAYYFNSSVSQGTLGGVAYRELSKVPIIGAGTDITIATNGYIANYITDAGDPSLLEIPAGNWNFEMFFSASSGGGSPSFYVELYKYDGTTFTLISSSSATPEGITNGTAIDLYTTALAVPLTTLTLTDRLAIRVYVNNSGRTITLHTENSHLCEVITTFSTGITALNGLTAQVQYFQVGTSGTDFNISSGTATHTFNLPVASALNTGKLSSSDFTTFNNKQGAITLTTTGTSGAATFSANTLNIPQYQAALTNPVTGTGTTNTLPKFTGASAIGNSNITDTGSLITLGSNTTISSGGLGIGTSSLTGYTLRLAKSVTGATNYYAIESAGTIQSDVTGSMQYFQSVAATQAATFTLSILRHYFAYQGTFGAGSTVTNQFGYLAHESLIGATNNFGFYGNIPSGTNNWNVFMNGTAPNFLSGVLNIGTTTLSGYKLDVNGTARFAGNSVLFQNTAGAAGTGYAMEFATNSLIPRVDFVVNGAYVGQLSASGTDMRFVNTTTGNLLFITNANQEKARITSGGSLGIGTTSIGAKLQVNNAATVGTGSTAMTAINPIIFVDNGNAANGSIVIKSHSVGAGNVVGALRFASSPDGANYNYAGIEALSSAGSIVETLVFKIPSTNASAATSNEIARIDINGLLIGTQTTIAGTSLVVGKMTGSTVSRGILSSGAIQSGVTSQARYFNSAANTAAASFTLTSLFHYYAEQGTIGAGSTVTNQYGYVAESNLTGATNNYGFYGNIASGTNRWNLYMSGTANNYMAGSLGIGTTSLTGYNLRVSKSVTGATTSRGITSDGVVQSDVVTAYLFATNSATAAAAFSTDIVHYFGSHAGTGAGSTITSNTAFMTGNLTGTSVFGFRALSSLTGSSTTQGFRGDIAAGTNQWNLYMNGTANNYMAGSLNIGTTSVLADYPLNAQGTVNGNLLFRFANLSNGTGARMGLILGTDFGAVGSIDAYSTTYTGGTADDTASGVRILASGVGGLSLRANNASATIRLYTGSTERVRVKSQGQMRFVPLTADPSGAEAGDIYYNSTTNKLKVYNGTAWETITSI